MNVDAESPGSTPAAPPVPRWPRIVLALVLALHAALVISTWGPTYWDFGDGNYMYISKRLTEGVTLYKDILAPQPPLHLMTGAGLSALGESVLGPERRYLAFRAFSLLLRSLTAVVLFLLVSRAMRDSLVINGATGASGEKGRPDQPASHRSNPSGVSNSHSSSNSASDSASAPSSDTRAVSHTATSSASAVALVAAAIWLFLPIGFWWQLGYQSEPLEILFLLLAVWGVWRMTPRSLLGAGVASALAAHCNMTAMPYFLCNALFLACRRPRRLAWYLPSFLVVYFAIAFAAETATGGFFWDNVVFNQTGTFPRSDILERSHGPGYGLFDYAIDKVARMGEKILNLEGVLIALAGVGLGLWSRRRRDEEPGNNQAGQSQASESNAQTHPSPEAEHETPGDPASGRHSPDALLARHRREYLAWTAIGHFLSIGFVAKGGTVDYIFTIGEPFVALFAALAAVALWTWLRPLDTPRTLRFSNTLAFLRVFAALFILGVAFYSPARYIRLCLDGVAAELPAAHARRVFYLIDHYSRPGDPILAPPFYAIMTNRNVAAEYSENYIWTIKYMNERTDAVVGEGVKKAQELARMLNKREIPFVLLDMAQTAKIPEIRQALEDEYRQIESEPYQTFNTQLTFWIPKERPINHLPNWRRTE